MGGGKINMTELARVSLSEVEIEKNIISMRDCAKELNRVTKELEEKIELKKQEESRVFLEETGTIKDREAKSRIEPKIVKYAHEIAYLKGRQQELMWQLKIFELEVNIWRSSNSSANLERKLYEGYSK